MSYSRFALSFDVENAAFTECPELEVARILRDVAKNAENGREHGNIRDYNGNTIGQWGLWADTNEPSIPPGVVIRLEGHEMKKTMKLNSAWWPFAHPETKLERAVGRWLKKKGRDYDNGVEGAYNDLLYGGCQSGIVGHLICYHDTLKFYKTHKKDIHVLLKDMLDLTGLSPHELFGEKWDTEDPSADEQSNQNLLAWFGFEESARNLMEREGVEV